MVKSTVARGALSGMTAAWSLLNLVCFAVQLGLGSDLAESWFNGDGITPRLFSAPRASSIALLMFGLLSGAVGCATSLLGVLHAAYWSETARFANLAASMITLAVTWLAGGFAVKVYRGDTGSMDEFPVKLRTLGAFTIITSLLMLLYVIFLGLFKHTERHPHNTVQPNTTTAPVTTSKHVDHHHQAAMHA